MASLRQGTPAVGLKAVARLATVGVGEERVELGFQHVSLEGFSTCDGSYGEGYRNWPSTPGGSVYFSNLGSTSLSGLAQTGAMCWVQRGREFQLGVEAPNPIIAADN